MLSTSPRSTSRWSRSAPRSGSSTTVRLLQCVARAPRRGAGGKGGPRRSGASRARGHVKWRTSCFGYQGRAHDPGRLLRGPARPAHRHRGADRRRQDDPDQPAHPLLRRRGGRILIDGIDLRELTLSSLRDQISVVLQEPLLFSGSIADNIRYGRLDARSTRSSTAARGGECPRLHLAPAEGLRHRAGRAGRGAVGRRAAAHLSSRGRSSRTPRS